MVSFILYVFLLLFRIVLLAIVIKLDVVDRLKMADFYFINVFMHNSSHAQWS